MPLVLLYHDVVDGDFDTSGFPGGDAARYKLERREFTAHLDAIAAAAPGPPTKLSPFTQREPGGDHPVGAWLLTFDDGGVSAAPEIADELERRGWRGHFFVTVDYIGRPGFVDRAQIRDLARRGHVIGSHSCSHPTRMAACSRSRMLEEWTRSREELSDILSGPVTTASVPGGYYSRAVAETAAEAGLAQLFNSEPTTRTRHVESCQVFGRYTIYRGMTAPMAAALVAGKSSALLKQAIAWKSKKVLKALGGGMYVGVRRALLHRVYGPRRSSGA
jgi:peptidoglycan/xylan/chitin deacetylase (PgdA/CDA1 family)